METSQEAFRARFYGGVSNATSEGKGIFKAGDDENSLLPQAQVSCRVIPV